MDAPFFLDVYAFISGGASAPTAHPFRDRLLGFRVRRCRARKGRRNGGMTFAHDALT